MIPTTELNLFLDPGGKGPLYQRLAEAVVVAIRDGRVGPGDALPGIRELGVRLGVHRNTVLTAMRELEAQGWVQAKARCGFYVAEGIPEAPGTGAGPGAGALGFEFPNEMGPVTDARDLLWDLSDGVADGRMVPVEALGQAYLRALRLKGPELLQASEFKGLGRLRNCLADHLVQRRGLAVEPDQLLVIRSTSMAVSLVAQTLIGPRGGAVAVEDPGNPAVWDTLRQASGAVLVPIPVDGQGLDAQALDVYLKDHALGLLILTPQAHYPTGVPLAPERRGRILELAARHRFPILELDPEHDHLRGEGSSHRPLMAADTTGQVMYAGSLSRSLAPGLRLAYLAMPASLADRMAKARQRVDWQGDAIQEWAVSDLFLDGEYRRHLRRVRKAFLERRAALVDALDHTFPGRLEGVGADPGAMGLWIRGDGPWRDPAAFTGWVRACNLKGIKLRPGAWFKVDGTPLAATRIGFTAYRPEELQAAVALMS